MSQSPNSPDPTSLTIVCCVESGPLDPMTMRMNEDTAGIASARLLHYHDSMGAHFWPQFLALIEPEHPELHAWLQPLGPAVDPSPKITQVMAKSLKAKRVLERNKYQSKMDLY